MELIKELPALGRDLGPGLILIGLTSLAAILVGCLFEEWETLPWMATATVSLCGIGLLLRFLPKTSKVPRTSTSIAATALVWVIVGLCGSLPFLFTGMSFLDAAFESMSAWTGTGFSVVADIESWPKTLLFWRSFMQWVGGLGIVAFTLTVATRSGLITRGMYTSESGGQAFMPSVIATAFQMWKIYAVLTVAAVLAILLTGVGLWDAVNLALCGIATGGMSIYAAGISHFQNFALEMVLIPIMIAGAVPFRLYYLTYAKRSIREFFAAIDFIDAGKYVNPNEPRWSDNEIVAFLQSRPSAESEFTEQDVRDAFNDGYRCGMESAQQWHTGERKPND